ncbi:MAG: STAS/SEC14 domain-containing protein [bacterium]
MPETITVREDLGVIEIRSFGKVTQTEMSTTRQRVEQILQKQGIRKILVDARDLTMTEGTTSLFEFGASFDEAPSFRFAHLALIVSEQSQQDLQFLATVAQNRGIQIKVLDSVDAGLEYLQAIQTQT